MPVASSIDSYLENIVSARRAYDVIMLYNGRRGEEILYGRGHSTRIAWVAGGWLFVMAI